MKGAFDILFYLRVIENIHTKHQICVNGINHKSACDIK